MPAKPSPEKTAGARAERHSILTKLKSLRKKGGGLADLELFIIGRAKRTAKDPGGVGKR